MNIYVRVICIFSFVFVFTSTAILQYTSVCHVVSAGAGFCLVRCRLAVFSPSESLSRRCHGDQTDRRRRTGQNQLTAQ